MSNEFKQGREWLTDRYWVTPYNCLTDMTRQFDLPKAVHIHDATLREAEQAPGIVLKPDEKIAIALALDRLGAYSIELFPAVSECDQEVVKALCAMSLKSRIYCLARCEQKDIDIAGDCGAKSLVIEGNANPWSCKATWDKDEKAIIKGFVDAIKYAKQNGFSVTCMPWDDFRAPLDFLERLYKTIVLDGGADEVVLVDTSGNSLPWTTVWLVKKLREWLPGTPVQMHAHNEFGLATSVMIAAVTAGASTVHTCINGLGNRAGNAATEEVAMGLEILLGVPTGIKLDQLMPVSELVADLTKVKVPANKAIVGDNLFTYQAGLSIFMFEKMKAKGRPHGYVPFVPELIGRDGHRTVLGKNSGKTSVRLKLEEFGIKTSPEQLAEITVRVKQESILRKGDISPSVLKSIAALVLSP